MCIQNLVSISLFVLKILNKNRILASIKGCNFVAKLRKQSFTIPKEILLTNNIVYTKFGLSLSIRSQDIEEKLNSGTQKGHNSVGILENDDLQSKRRSCY